MTELTLPDEMRRLMRRINAEVLASARQQILLATEQRDRDLVRAAAIVEDAKEKMAAKKIFYETEFQNEIRAANDWHERELAALDLQVEDGKKIKEGTERHYELLGRALPSTTSGSIRASDPTNSQEIAIVLSEARSELSKLQLLTPAGTILIGFVSGCASLLLLAIAAQAAYSGTEPGTIHWAGGIGGMAFLVACFCFAYDHFSRSRSERMFQNISDCLDKASEMERVLRQRVVDKHEGRLSVAQQNKTSAGFLVSGEYDKAMQLSEAAHASLDVRYKLLLSGIRESIAEQTAQVREDVYQLIQTAGYAASMWHSSMWSQWQTRSTPSFTACFGRLTPPVEDLNKVFPDLDLSLFLPALIPFNEGKCLLIEASDSSKEDARKCLQSVLFRLLATIPPGKLNFIFIDPVGLGQGVAGFMRLAEYDETLIKNRAWTETQHIEQRLAELTEHMENVIQKYLRTDYKNIEEYNEQAGEVAEPYRVLVIMDFPTNFTETAARRLISVATNGPRCGVYTVIMRDANQQSPHGFNPADLERHSFLIRSQGSEFTWDDEDFRSCHLMLDEPPQENLAARIVEEVGEKAKDAGKVEVPFEKLLLQARLDEENWWRGSTERSLNVPLGPTGARKLQHFSFGEGLTHHGLIVGRPGSGKTNLMHVIITTLALKYSPEELQLYLVDFKKGVGFKPYADYQLPHAVAIAIESEREFGLSVLQGLDSEMQRRGEIFRKESVEELAEYRRKTNSVLPRILLLADEFQEFFTHSDNLAAQAGVLLDRLTRQGRAFGIHIVLGTQTLQGSNSLPKSTLNQIAVRIALQCSADDSRIVLADDNPAARLLSRPGEAIYNSANGLVEGNNFFQVALFTDDDRKAHLKIVQDLGKGNGTRTPPIVFEGNEPASIEHCRPLKNLILMPVYPDRSRTVSAWLGEPTSIREPVAARLRRQSGSNLLIVSRDEAEGLGMIVAALLSLATQHSPEGAKFLVASFVTAYTPWIDLLGKIPSLLPHTTTVFGRRQLPALFKELLAEIGERINNPQPDISNIYLIIAGLHRARDLRQDESGSNDDGIDANELLVSILRDGPEVGVHVIAWCDSYSNLSRVLSRRQLSEFGLRVAGAMSNDDSQNLVDDSAAAKLDKPHRAILYDEERPGLLEKLRPYGLPSEPWLKQLQEALLRRVKQASNLPDSASRTSN